MIDNRFIKVKAMSANNTHKKMLLSRNQSGQIAYCKTCEIVEIEIGPVSVRLHEQDLNQFCELVKQAELQLNNIHDEKFALEKLATNIERLH
jgi:hypothetical protein